ncbi:MAG TPA: recombination-associated protein RdgC [Pseudomonadales bacterium]
MFRNLRLYRLHSPWPESEAALSAQLEQAAFQPCGPYSERSSGWEAPAGEGVELLCRRVAGADLLRLRSQVRLLPAAAVNEALEDRVAEFTKRMQRSPGRREKRQLKDEVHAELMPRALVKSERVKGFCLIAEELIAIDTASEAQAERFLDKLRDALGSLKVTPLKFRQPFAQLINRVFLGDGPPVFRPGRECRMQDPAAGAAVVSFQDIDLTDDDVQRHVRNGLKLTRLGLVFDELLTCVIDQDGVIRKLRLQGMDEAEDREEDALARLDAEFALLTGATRRLIEALRKALGGFD